MTSKDANPFLYLSASLQTGHILSTESACFISFMGMLLRSKAKSGFAMARFIPF
jgi:hypothetical protein